MMTVEELCGRLLQTQCEIDRKIHQLEEELSDNMDLPDAIYQVSPDLVEIVLDALGVPAEKLPAISDLEVESAEVDDNDCYFFCRDWLTDIWTQEFVKTDRDPREFIPRVKAELAEFFR